VYNHIEAADVHKEVGDNCCFGERRPFEAESYPFQGSEADYWYLEGDSGVENCKDSSCRGLCCFKN